MKKVPVFILLAITLMASYSVPAQAAQVTPAPEEVFYGHRLAEEWRVEEAEAYTKRLLEEFSESGDAHFLHARVQFLKGNYDYSWEILKHVSGNHREVQDFKTLVNETREATRGFVAVESDHFIFRYVEGPDQVLIPFAQEALERSYQVLGRLLDYHPQEKVVVEIYPDREPFSKISPLTMKDIVTSGTVALCKYNRITMISPGSLVRGYNWMDTLSHEYVHYILTRKSRNTLPLWMHEGIAKYYETRWREGVEYLTPIMETVLASGLKNEYLISLDSMMPSLAKLKTAEDVQLAYAEVSTMVEYLVVLKGEQVLPLILEDLAEGKPFKDTLEQRIGTDLTAFQENWKIYMKPKKLRSIPGLKPLETQFKKDRAAKEDQKEYDRFDSRQTHDLTFLGDILKSRNHYKAAIVEYQKAIEANPILSPILINKLATTHSLTREYDEAEALLVNSLKYYPMFHTTLVSLGEIYFETDRLDQAREYYEQALRINPFNPYVHVKLIKVYSRLGLTLEKELQAKLYRYIQ